MAIATINPATGKLIMEFTPLTSVELDQKLELSAKAQQPWRQQSVNQRADILEKLAIILREKRDALAHLITLEMGCPLAQAKSEIEKSAYICEHTASEARLHLKSEKVVTDAEESYIAFEPLGTIFHIAPWNYPFYLALRPVIPALLAGNTVVMKHASNVPQCALAIEACFLEAGLPVGVFQTLLITTSQVEKIINHPSVQMITLIGSEKTGSAVGQLAGKAIKKTLMELGGNDPMIILEDVDMTKVIEAVINSRLRNCGQSCNAVKRCIVARSRYEEFLESLQAAMQQEIIGDPLDSTTTIGPLATEGALLEIERQITTSVRLGARLIQGGNKVSLGSGFYFEPTIITDINPKMPVYNEEVFGPVISVFPVDSIEEAVQVANDSDYGLGASIWTQNVQLAKTLIPQIQAGNVYINRIVRGNPKLPFGGVKKTGFGREFGKYGLLEFVNLKSVVINSH